MTFFCACEQKEVNILDADSTHHLTYDGENQDEFDNETISFSLTAEDVDDSKYFSMFSKVYYQNKVYTSEEAENSTVLIDAMNSPNTSLVATQDLDKLETFFRSNKSLFEQPKHDVLYLYNSQEEADVFLEDFNIKRDRLESEGNLEVRANCQSTWRAGFKFYTEYNCTGTSWNSACSTGGQTMTYSPIRLQWNASTRTNLPASVSNKVSAYSVSIYELPANNKPRNKGMMNLYKWKNQNGKIHSRKMLPHFECSHMATYHVMSLSANRYDFPNNKAKSFLFKMYGI